MKTFPIIFLFFGLLFVSTVWLVVVCCVPAPFQSSDLGTLFTGWAFVGLLANLWDTRDNAKTVAAQTMWRAKLDAEVAKRTRCQMQLADPRITETTKQMLDKTITDLDVVINWMSDNFPSS